MTGAQVEMNNLVIKMHQKILKTETVSHACHTQTGLDVQSVPHIQQTSRAGHAHTMGNMQHFIAILDIQEHVINKLSQVKNINNATKKAMETVHACPEEIPIVKTKSLNTVPSTISQNIVSQIIQLYVLPM